MYAGYRYARNQGRLSSGVASYAATLSLSARRGRMANQPLINQLLHKMTMPAQKGLACKPLKRRIAVGFSFRKAARRGFGCDTSVHPSKLGLTLSDGLMVRCSKKGLEEMGDSLSESSGLV